MHELLSSDDLKLMNQLDVSGPPPAAKEHVDALPVMAITQEQVGELQSASCVDKAISSVHHKFMKVTVTFSSD